jgi:hypothetical protein
MIESISKHFPTGIVIPSELKALCEWNEKNGYPISGYFELRSGDGDDFFYWFGSRHADSDLALFGAGGDGSMYCVWKQEDGRQPIVHLGSEGDELKVLAKDMEDFLRLLAVGYGDLGHEDTSLPPEDKEEINPTFQNWIKNELKLTIPETGDEIIKTAISTHDDFAAWVTTKTN